MIIMQDRFSKDNYDNRTIKLCLRSYVDSSEIRSLFFDVISTLQFDKSFDCVYLYSKKGLFGREATRFLSTPLHYDRLLKKNGDCFSHWSLAFMERNAEDAVIRLSEAMHTPPEETAYGVVSLPPEKAEMRQYSIDSWSDEQLKKAILSRNVQLFDDHNFFTGVRPAAITVRFFKTPLMSLYIEIDKGLLSDDTTRRLAEEWRMLLERFATFEGNAGSYLGMDNAIMSKTAHEEYFYCSDRERASSFPGYLWCNLLNHEQFSKIDLTALSADITIVPIGKNYEIAISKDIVDASYTDYRRLRTAFTSVLPSGTFRSLPTGELSNRMTVVLLDDDILVNNGTTTRRFSK